MHNKMVLRQTAIMLATALMLSGAGDALAEGKEAQVKKNRLANEKSPYLLKHATNPVDWYPWGDEAFARARKENKPVFLSIGYSACHWCNVMERESFSDPEVAALMNEIFISVKVDREERPDIDSVYMSASILLTGTGGWPLNVILTPDRKPFYATTYVPKEAKYGRPGMMDLLPRIKEVWEERRDEIDRSAESVTGALESALRAEPGGEPGLAELEAAYKAIGSRFDNDYGGFGSAPKFPAPHALAFLLRYHERTGKKDALDMAERTLKAMRRGGVFDQLGYGFHRYSTDAEWKVPHFEKMLNDQALMAYVYTEAFQATGDPEYERTAREIFAYVLRDMTSDEGGFYTAEDADSEGIEGRFYLWTEDEAEAVLGKKVLKEASRMFNMKPEGNFKDPTGEVPEGANVLFLGRESAPLIKGKAAEALREKLFRAREDRASPFKDEKVLTDWNGLMIASLALGARAFDDESYAASARQAADFVLHNLRDKSGLLHRWSGGDAGIRAGAEDYAFFIWGLTELYESIFDPEYLKAALDLTDEFIEGFWDGSAGGFYLVPEGAEVPVRPKEIADSAMPSSNSVAILDLIRLSHLTGRADLEDKAREALKSFAGNLRHSPEGHLMTMAALDLVLGPSREVVVVGRTDAEDTREMLRALGKAFAPRKVVVFVPAEEGSPAILKLAEFASYKKMEDGRATAYVCTDQVCKAPTTDVKEMLGLLKKK